ncbi:MULTISPECIES: helix-turn-helix domain-containing protein [Actinoallomurus]|uniref:helix-turn-helix domain-containing protein n=1 Tax=Actinoallomurus TaxID=667113 RepID=UPI00209074D2|nr:MULTISPECIES: helix-turn-helix transcriptional regulator [Actinoallomurus]MCO5970657.1 helix-turn-helix domain-containing protein [Actinoallomurus soli]MCO5993569.1 helix-turn-helix domain-containing protein [Actinoallomurus rhizosphaericola]
MPPPRKLDAFSSLGAFFGAEVRRLRERNGWTLDELAHKLGWALSTVASVETARRNPPDGFPERADTLFALPDMLTRLAELVRSAPRWFEHYVELESQANKISIWANSLIPGLFQTEDYAQAVIRANRPMISDDDIGLGVARRLGRQSLFDRSDPPLLWVVLHETVVKQPIGNAEMTLAQLRRLVDLARLPFVNLQVLPFAAAQLTGATGPFTIFEFVDQSPVAFAEGRQGGWLIDRKEEIAEIALTYDRLRAAALSPDESIGMIVGAMGQTWIDRA